MIFALDVKGERISIEESVRGEKYFCPCCNSEVIQKKGNVNMWHYAHKNLGLCDEWYSENEWTKFFSEKFPEQFREVVVTGEGGRKRIAHIKVGNVVLQLQDKSMTSSEFQQRVNFFSQNNALVWLVDLRDKNIHRKYTRNSRTNKTLMYEWKHAWKFNDMDKFTNRKLDLFFQLDDDLIIKVIWNRQGFKIFGGYKYTVESFMNFLRRKYKNTAKVA